MENLIDNMTSYLTPGRAAILAPAVFEKLRASYPFASGRVISAGSLEEAASKAGLSGRQFARAVVSLASDNCFWDRVGNRILLSMSSMLAGGSILVLLEGTGYPAMGPDEAGRWLPVLVHLVSAEFRLQLKKNAVSTDGNAPSMTSDMASYLLNRSDAKEVSLLRFAPDETFRKHSVTETVEDVRQMPGAAAACQEFAVEGAGKGFFWCLAPELSGSDLSTLVKGSGLPGFMKQGRISSITGTTLNRGLTHKEIRKRIIETERAADILGAALFCSHDLEEFYRKTGVCDLPALHDHVVRITRGRRRSVAIVSPALPEKASPALAELMPCGDNMSLLVLKPWPKRFSRPADDWAVKWLKEETAGIPDTRFTAGIASTWQENTGSGSVLVSAIWAFLHAKMLGEGNMVAHNEVTWQLRGDELSGWNNHAGACRAYRCGLALNPDNAEILNSLGVALAAAGRLRESASCFRKAAGKNSRDFMVFYNLAGVLIRDGRKDEAVESAKRALALAPDNPACVCRMAESLTAAGRTPETIRLVEKFNERDGSDIPLLNRVLAEALMEQGRWNEARKKLEAILARKPDDAEARKMLASGYAVFEKDLETAKRFAPRT